MLNSSLYVDDLFHGADNLENAYRLSCDAVTILGSAGMKLRKLQTNSSELKELWIKNKFNISDSLNESKILGMIWLPDEDILKLDITALIESLDGIKDTKRHVLKTVSKIYDPTCMAAPFVIRIKILMQNIWQRGLDWDDELPQDLKINWRQWCSEIHHLSDFYIKRNFLLNVNKSDKKVILHVFADASPKAYGSVAYVQYLDEENKFSTNFIISKTRVSPLKLLTLPRLELMAAVVAARLGKYLLELFPHLFKEVYYWTDSEIVIHWLKGDYTLWKPFISNRVAEVHLLSNPMSWRHCSGKNNPADLVTKGLDSISLKSCSLWQHGPEWLKKSCDNWPEQKINSVNKEDLEYRSSVLVNNNIVQNKDVIDISRFSNLKRLLRVSAWIKRFINRIRKLPTESGPLTALEIENAEIFWIRKVQSEVYASEIQTLEKKITVSAESSIYSLAPYLDGQGILRIKGRLEESECTFEEKSPIILPKNSKFTELLVQHEHFKVLHSGVAVTLTRIRRKYWIPKGRQLVKKIIGSCLICSKYAVKPANQLTAQIPKDRISEIPAFSIVGLDFTGPVMVRNGKDVQKAYIALFTCAVTRAVHLELVSDMSSKRFLLSFRRFVSRRGNCRIIYSDNAKSFKAANKDLNYFYKLIIKDTEIKDFIASEEITWKFIVERAPWWGGFYERLMRSIKEPLKKILGKALLTFEEMLTILTEIEVVLNQRPLTYNYNDHNEPVPLTPSNFLHFGRKSFAYPCNFAELVNKASSKEALTKRKLYQTKLLKQLWLKWKDLYLLNLRTAHHFVTPVSQTNLKVNDVVIVEGNTKNKLLWNLGLIHEVILGRDGNVRACVVKTAKGQYKRPIQLLYPLEISEDNKT